MYSDGYEMRDFHRAILAKSRLFLLHNIRPTEALWGTMLEKELLSQDMLDDIKTLRTISEQIGRLLDILPARGPMAFDLLCEALLQCDHAHAGEYLKNMEAVEQFREEIEPHCSDYLMERYVNIFKRSVPSAQRFIERKFEMILEEQDRELRDKESEVNRLDSDNTRMTVELSQLRSFTSCCVDTADRLSRELDTRRTLSRDFIESEKQAIGKSKEGLKDTKVMDKLCKYFDDLLVLLTYIDSLADSKLTARDGDRRHVTDNDNDVTNSSTTAVKAKRLLHQTTSLQDRMQLIVTNVGHVMDKVSAPGVKAELEVISDSLKTVSSDIIKVKDALKRTIRQKRLLEGELVSLLHSLQEIRRLEREAKEKQTHITELNNQGQVMKKKSKHSRKLLDDIRLSIEQRKIQLLEVQQTLQRRLSSADQRMHHLLDLLPDLEDADLARTDTELSINTSTLSRSITPAWSVHQILTPRTKAAEEGGLLARRRQQDEDEEESRKEATALVGTARRAMQCSDSVNASLVVAKVDSQKPVKALPDKRAVTDSKKSVDQKPAVATKTLQLERKSLNNTRTLLNKQRKDDSKATATVSEASNEQVTGQPPAAKAPMSLIDQWLEKEKQNAPSYGQTLMNRMSRLQTIVPTPPTPEIPPTHDATALTSSQCVAAVASSQTKTTSAAVPLTVTSASASKAGAAVGIIQHDVQVAAAAASGSQVESGSSMQVDNMPNSHPTDDKLSKVVKSSGSKQLDARGNGKSSAGSNGSSDKENDLQRADPSPPATTGKGQGHVASSDLLQVSHVEFGDATGIVTFPPQYNNSKTPGPDSRRIQLREKTGVVRWDAGNPGTSGVSNSTQLQQTASFGVVNNILAARKQQEQLHLQREQLKASRVDLKLPGQ